MVQKYNFMLLKLLPFAQIVCFTDRLLVTKCLKVQLEIDYLPSCLLDTTLVYPSG